MHLSSVLYYFGKNGQDVMRKELLPGSAPQRVGGGYHLQPWTKRYRPPNLELMPILEDNATTKARPRLNRREEALIRACIGGDEIGAKTAIRHGVNVNCLDEVGQTPIIKAARHNNAKVLKLLVNAAADMNVQDENGWSALFWAAQAGSRACVEELIQPENRQLKGCDLNCKSHSQLRPHNVAITIEIRSMLKNAPQQRLLAGEPMTYDDKLEEGDEFEAELEGVNAKAALNSKKIAAAGRGIRNKSFVRGVRKARKMLTSAWGYHRLTRKKEDFDAMTVISREMVSEPKTEPMVYSALWRYQGRTPMISFGNWAQQDLSGGQSQSDV